MNSALQAARTVLDNNRNPQYPADVPHSYDDKYLLVNYVVNTYLAGQLNALQALGLDKDGLSKLRSWAKSRSVSLCFEGEERCTFLRKAERKIEPSTEYVDEYKSSSGFKSKWTSKVVKKVTEWFWKFEVEYKLIAVKGSGSSSKEQFTVVSRSGDCELVTTTEDSPLPKVSLITPCKVQITWLLQQLGDDNAFEFSIDRAVDSCRTPRRNPQVDAAFAASTALSTWATNVNNYIRNKLIPTQKDHELDLAPLSEDTIFSPIVPTFEEGEKKKPDHAAADMLATLPVNADSVLLSYDDANAYLALQKDSITARFESFDKLYPLKGLVTPTEARLCAIGNHLSKNAANLADAVEGVEGMLRAQLIGAIGKVIGPVEFANYMRFHNRKVFKEKYAPKPYSYAIRRPEHSPEGTLSIESTLADGSMAEPIFSIVRHSVARAPMRFPISAATEVSFLGDRYLHAWIGHQFSNSSGMTLNLAARARQFSSFILMVGSIAGAAVFEPKFGIIIQNKDDLKIPLLLEQIPTPKEFRDAIESLSPEQQRFAKAFRSMQLESTLFGVAVIQIKPQLEKLLKLPEDSLTKEIRLTQDLLELFIKYQIPSDLLSYDGQEEASCKEKLDVVKGYVKAMFDMIQSKKETEIEEKKQEMVYNIAATIAQPDKLECVRERGSAPKMMKKRKKMDFKRAKSAAKPSAPKPMAVPAPVPQQQQQQQAAAPEPVAEAPPKAPEQAGEKPHASVIADEHNDSGCEDFTKYPALLDEKYALLDEDNALRPTIVKPGTTWTKKYQASLLAKPATKTLGTEEQREERNKAFDLLDALSRSGALPVDHAELHVVMAATHCFDKALLETIVQDNVNPIEKVERSTLIVATTVHDLPASELVSPDRIESVRTASPALFPDNDLE